MKNTYNKMAKQNYENYWSLTNAFTDYNSVKFIRTLEISLNFMEQFKEEKFSQNKYERLQAKLNFDDVNTISIRKRINQLVKLGFINPFLKSYHPDAKLYLEAKTNKRRATLLSKIVYSNSKLNASVNEDSSLHQINFLLKTLEEVGQLSIDDIIGLMQIPIARVSRGYLTHKELETLKWQAETIDFKSRKYNQISHFLNLLKKLDDLVLHEDVLYFKDDIELPKVKENTKRDSYLHRIYKNHLKEESEEKIGSISCMVENLVYPSLIASHIKPYIQSNENEAYDPDNGLLLSRNLDALFDQGYISFDENGFIICSKLLNEKLSSHLKEFHIDPKFLHHNRLKYLRYHRD